MSTSPATHALPIIDIASANRSDADFGHVAAGLDRACAEFGFFYVTGHGIDPGLAVALEQLAQRFFALPVEEKLEIAMTRGGRAWRGYFPLGGEFTSGRPDRKEGIYFGTELGPDEPRVKADLPFVLAGHDPVAVGSALNQEGIAVRAGHHCAEPILHRFSVTATVRPSLAFYNTCQEVDTLTAAVHRLVGQSGRR
jgi:isopenicillin N synthase-like dioxygenase